MAFKPIRYDCGQLDQIKMAASATVAKYDAVDYASGYLQRATSSSTECRYVAMEDRVTGSGENTELLVLKTDGVEFEADTAADPVVATDVGVKADLTDHDTLNESASSNDVFLITKVVGATTDRKVRGYFVQKVA